MSNAPLPSQRRSPRERGGRHAHHHDPHALLGRLLRLGAIADGVSTLCLGLVPQAPAPTATLCLLHQRRAMLRAQQAGQAADSLPPLGAAAPVAARDWPQAIVLHDKSRNATWHDLGQAWRMLAPGGRMVLLGGNEVGIGSSIDRVTRELAIEPALVKPGEHGRAGVWVKPAGCATAPQAVEPTQVPLCADADAPLLSALPGVFAARGLDAGTNLLQQQAVKALPQAQVILDLGCGAGHLALHALRQRPHAKAVLLDADARAVASARANATTLGCADRADVQWWDADEALPALGARGPVLALCNPPCHVGAHPDLGVARRLFDHLLAVIATIPDSEALVVANRRLPYEGWLGDHAQVRSTVLVQDKGFKVLRMRAQAAPA